MARRRLPAEWTTLAPHFDEINAQFIDYEGQVGFLLECAERLRPRLRSALDLGCATGLHARALADRGTRVVGVDLSPRLLAQGRRAASRPGRPHLVCGDLAALPLRGRFDLAYALNFVMSFLHTNEALLTALAEVRRMLAPGGLFVMDYHYYFPPEADAGLREGWRETCVVNGRRLVVGHDPTVDWATQLCTDEMAYRFMDGRRVAREIRTREVRRISLPQDLVGLVQASGFELLAHCRRFDLDAEPEETGVLVGRRGRSQASGGAARGPR
jgi:SAM-dependent methyltransferase